MCAPFPEKQRILLIETERKTSKTHPLNTSNQQTFYDKISIKTINIFQDDYAVFVIAAQKRNGFCITMKRQSHCIKKNKIADKLRVPLRNLFANGKSYFTISTLILYFYTKRQKRRREI